VNASRSDAIALCRACYALVDTGVGVRGHHRVSEAGRPEVCVSCGAPATEWVVPHGPSHDAVIDVDLTGAIIRVSIDGIVDGDRLAALAAEVARVGKWQRPIMVDLRGIRLSGPTENAVERFARTMAGHRGRVALLVDEDLMPDAVPAGVVVGRDIADIVERLTEG
jgi:hypothetical protein